MLGCPNQPQGAVGDEDGQAGAALRSSDQDVGCLFWAHRNHGAYTAPLWDEQAPAVRIQVADLADASGARFMESVESRHSSHDTTAAMVSCCSGAARREGTGTSPHLLAPCPADARRWEFRLA